MGAPWLGVISIETVVQAGAGVLEVGRRWLGAPGRESGVSAARSWCRQGCRLLRVQVRPDGNTEAGGPLSSEHLWKIDGAGV